LKIKDKCNNKKERGNANSAIMERIKRLGFPGDEAHLLSACSRAPVQIRALRGQGWTPRSPGSTIFFAVPLPAIFRDRRLIWHGK
jgi:hypothetical protein